MASLHSGAKTMKPDITIYILPSDKHSGIDCNFAKESLKTVRSVSSIAKHVKLLKNRNIAAESKNCKTKWWMYLFSDEIVPEELTTAIQVFAFTDKWDYFVLLRKYGEQHFGFSPRLFKSGVEIEEGKMIPKNIEAPHERILNGYIINVHDQD